MTRSLVATATACALLLGATACESDVPTAASEAPHAAHPTGGGTTLEALLQDETRPDVRRQILELGRITARYHNVDQAVEDGYDANVGCLDETLGGTDLATARGMGYHVTKSAGIIDGVVDLLEPEFLVYAPHPRDASFPEDERVAKARLVGVEYFVPGSADDPDPPQLFGETFDWNPLFGAWVRHIYLWGVNPEGIYENYNAAIPLCTQLLAGEPIG